MDPVRKVVAAVVQNVGGTFVVGVLAATVAAFAFIKQTQLTHIYPGKENPSFARNWTLERCINMSQEISLLGAHLLIMTSKDNYGNWIACTAVALALHYFYAVHFSFLVLEAIQAYAVLTSVALGQGFLTRRVNLVIGWGFPFLLVGTTAVFFHSHYVTRVQCVLDLTGNAATVVLWPLLSIIVFALILTEAIGMDVDRFPVHPNHDSSQLTTARVAASGLVIIIPLSAAAWLLTLFSISGQVFSLFTIVFALNLALATALFLFHALSNPLVRSIFVVIYRKLKSIFCPGRWKRVEDGSFASDFLDHEYKIYKII